MTMVEKLSPGMSVTQARRLLAGLLREDGIESADLDARLLIEAALAIDHAALASQSDRTLSMAETHAIGVFATRRLDREPVARILGRRNSGACRSGFRRTRWCRGRKPRRLSRPRSRRSRSQRTMRCASPISAPVPARSCSPCSANCRTRSASEPIAAPAHSRPRASTRPICNSRSGRVFRGLRFFVGARRRLRSHRFKSALYRDRRYRPSADRCERPRSAPRARWRRGWSDRLSRDRRRFPPDPCTARVAGGRAWLWATCGRFGRYG